MDVAYPLFRLFSTFVCVFLLVSCSLCLVWYFACAVLLVGLSGVFCSLLLCFVCLAMLLSVGGLFLGLLVVIHFGKTFKQASLLAAYGVRAVV